MCVEVALSYFLKTQRPIADRFRFTDNGVADGPKVVQEADREAAGQGQLEAAAAAAGVAVAVGGAGSALDADSGAARSDVWSFLRWHGRHGHALGGPGQRCT